MAVIVEKIMKIKNKKKVAKLDKVLLITPPFSQFNTPYPATTCLKGFLNTKGISSFQCDLGLEVFLKLFSEAGLTKIFFGIDKIAQYSANAKRIFALRKEYILTIDAVVGFLQNKNLTLAHLICNDEFLPESSRFENAEEMDLAFGNLGIHDKAKHLATLYLEDISDFIVECCDDDFGFSRYAEQIALAAKSFDEIYEKTNNNSLIHNILIDLLKEKLEDTNATVVGLSVPFPGNLLGALKCGQWIKKHKPNVKIIFGGGYANTELRSLSEKRIFEFIDYITLDDGEEPLLHLLEFFAGNREIENLTRTYTLRNNEVTFYNGSNNSSIKQNEKGIQDFSDFDLSKYLSVIEIANPMHRLWNDGKWMKMTMAHGCYWAKCSFCDVSLDYIKRYEPQTVKSLCDNVETIMQQTGESGFHFVDEAAPPVLMRAFAIEVIRRRLNITWWTNVRFERSFTADLCILLKQSGCIAVSGGLEVASNRILKMINKGIDIEQVANVTAYFAEAGIMVHAYLMYGFPTQTEQETINSLEVVRQLFEKGTVHSAFWHKFSMTTHSPIGLNPKRFQVNKIDKTMGTFANNEIRHNDPTGCNHDIYAQGLRKSLYNFMHGIGLDFDLQEWFDFPIPLATIDQDRIYYAISSMPEPKLDLSRRVLWLGNKPIMRNYKKKKKGKIIEMTEIQICNRKEDVILNIKSNYAVFIVKTLEKCSVYSGDSIKLSDLQNDFEANLLDDFQVFWTGYEIGKLRETGLLIL